MPWSPAPFLLLLHTVPRLLLVFLSSSKLQKGDLKEKKKKKDHFVPARRTEQLISPGSYSWGDAPQKKACFFFTRKKSFLWCFFSCGEATFSRDRQELRHPEDGSHHFGAAQASTRTWEGVRVSMERWGAAHQPGTHGEQLRWSKQSHFISPTTASTSSLGDAGTGGQAKGEKKTQEKACVAMEEVYAGASKLCPWGEQQNSPNLHLSRPVFFFFLQGCSAQSKSESLL